MMFITEDGGFRFETKGNEKTFLVTGNSLMMELHDAGRLITIAN